MDRRGFLKLLAAAAVVPVLTMPKEKIKLEAELVTNVCSRMLNSTPLDASDPWSNSWFTDGLVGYWPFITAGNLVDFHWDIDMGQDDLFKQRLGKVTT